MPTNIRLTEMHRCCCVQLTPTSYTAAAYITDEIDMNKWSRVVFIVTGGCAWITSATLDFVVKGGSATNAGSHSTTVTGKSITQLTQAGSRWKR
jgi:hypothetical protein